MCDKIMNTRKSRCDDFGDKLHSSNKMQNLLGDFRSLYENRLQRLEPNDIAGEETNKTRVKILESYVNDLSDQNEVLIQTVEELEREAQKRVELLESSLLKTSEAVKNSKSENQIRELRSQVTHYQDLHAQSKLEVQKLTSSLQKLQISSKSTRDALTFEVNERHDNVVRLNEENRDLDGKLCDALSSSQQRGDVVDKLKDEMKELSTRCQILQSRLDEAEDESLSSRNKCETHLREVERLNMVINESDLSHRQLESLAKSELDDKTGVLARLQGETSMLHDKLTQAESRIRTSDGHRTQLDQQVANLQADVTRRETELQRLEYDMQSQYHERDEALNELRRIEIRVENSESELVNTRHLCKEAVEENGRLEARIQAYALNSQSEQDMLNAEVQRREEGIRKIKFELLDLQETNSKLVEKKSQLQSELDHSNTQLKNVQHEAEVHKRSITNLEAEVHSERDRSSTQHSDMSRLGDELRSVNIDLSAITARADSLQTNLANKEEVIDQLRGDLELVQRHHKESNDKVSQRDDVIQKLSAEIAKYKSKIVERTTQLQRYTDMVKSLQENIHQNKADLELTSKKANDDINKKDKRIQQLQEDLLESQSQYTGCYNELIKHEDMLDTLKCDNTDLNDSGLRYQQDVTLMREQLQQVELELTISQEKHRTCQNEVSERDQIILKLQTELDSMQQKYTGGVEELNIREDEMVRLNARVKELQANIKELYGQMEQDETQNKDNKLKIQELEHEYEMAQDEVKKQRKCIEAVKGDCESMSATHNEELLLKQEEMEGLRDEVDVARGELYDARCTITELKGSVEMLEAQLESAHKLNEDNVIEMQRQEDMIKSHDEILEDDQHQLRELEERLAECRSECSRLTADLTECRDKYSESVLYAASMEQRNSSVQIQLAELRTKEIGIQQEKEQAFEAARSMENLLKETKHEVLRCEEVMEQLTEELNGSQDDLRHAQAKLHEGDENLRNLNMQYEEKQNECQENEERLSQLEDEISSYMSEHSHTDKEFVDNEERITQLEFDLEDNGRDLETKTKQISDLQNEISAYKLELTSLCDQRDCSTQQANCLENSVQELQVKMTTLHQRQKSQLEKLEKKREQMETELEMTRTKLQSVERELHQKDDRLKKDEADIAACQSGITERLAEIEKLSELVYEHKQTITAADKRQRQADNCNAELQGGMEQMKIDVSEARAQYKDCAQELAHHEEKCMLLKQSLQTTQEQLSLRVTEVVRLELSNQKTNTEVKTLRERCTRYEDEIGEQKDLIDKLRKDVLNAKEGFQLSEQQGLSCKQQLHKLKVEMEGMLDHEKMLTNQVEQQDHILLQLQVEIKAERLKDHATMNQLQKSEKLVCELEGKVEGYDKQTKELTSTVLDREEAVMKLKARISEHEQHVKAQASEIVERDGELHSLRTSLHTAQSQAMQHNHKILWYEEALANFQAETERNHEQRHTCQNELSTNEQRLHELKVQLTSLEGKHKECMDQLNERSKELITLKTVLSKCQQHEHSLTDEVIIYEEKMRKMRAELKKLQEVNIASEDEVKYFESRYTKLQAEITMLQGRHKQAEYEVGRNEGETVAMRVDLSRLQMNHKADTEQIEKFKSEITLAEKNYKKATEQIQNLQDALQDSQANGKRLHKESELVVYNVNQWVHEQKNANEKLGHKIRDQSKAVAQLMSERDELMKQIDRLQKQNNKLQLHSEVHGREDEKMQDLEEQSAEQQALIHELQSLLRQEDGLDLSNKTSLVEDLQTRLKLNVDSMQQLSLQVSSQQKENVQLRSLLNQETNTRQTLQLQVEGKEQVVAGLKAQLDNKGHQLLLQQPPPPKQEVRGPEENSEYWVNKVHELSRQLEKVRTPTAPTRSRTTQRPLHPH